MFSWLLFWRGCWRNTRVSSDLIRYDAYVTLIMSVSLVPRTLYFSVTTNDQFNIWCFPRYDVTQWLSTSRSVYYSKWFAQPFLMQFDHSSICLVSLVNTIQIYLVSQAHSPVREHFVTERNTNTNWILEQSIVKVDMQVEFNDTIQSQTEHCFLDDWHLNVKCKNGIGVAISIINVFDSREAYKMPM